MSLKLRFHKVMRVIQFRRFYFIFLGRKRIFFPKDDFNKFEKISNKIVFSYLPAKPLTGNFVSVNCFEGERLRYRTQGI